LSFLPSFVTEESLIILQKHFKKEIRSSIRRGRVTGIITSTRVQARKSLGKI